MNMARWVVENMVKYRGSVCSSDAEPQGRRGRRQTGWKDARRRSDVRDNKRRSRYGQWGNGKPIYGKIWDRIMSTNITVPLSTFSLLPAKLII